MSRPGMTPLYIQDPMHEPYFTHVIGQDALMIHEIEGGSDYQLSDDGDGDNGSNCPLSN